MTKTIKAIALCLAIAGYIFAALDAHAGEPTVIKRADLPGNLKGGKVAKNTAGVPSCTVGRAKMAGNDMDAEPMLTWSGSHQNHPCFGAAVVYVCRAGKNLSVRCE